MKKFKLYFSTTTSILINSLKRLSSGFKLNKSKFTNLVKSKIPIDSNIKFKFSYLYIGYLIIIFSYFGFMARDRYLVSSKFVIKNHTSEGTGGTALSLNSPSSIVQGSIEDGRFLITYLRSQSVFSSIYENTGNLKAIRPIHTNRRLTHPKKNEPRLNFINYRKRHELHPDIMSGILTLKTYGFTPQSAHKMNKILINESKNFFKSVNNEISSSQLEFSRKQLNKAKIQLTLANNTLNNFKDSNKILNATLEKDNSAEFLSNLQNRLIDLKVDYASVRNQYLDPQAPELVYLQDQIYELEKQIKQERNKILLNKSEGLNQLSTESSRLESDVIYAADAYKGAKANYEATQRESQEQMKYMIMLSNPYIPSTPDRRWRFKAIVISLGILALLISLRQFISSTLITFALKKK